MLDRAASTSTSPDMLNAERAAKLCTIGPSADGFSFAATKLFASSQGLVGGLDALASLQHLTHVEIGSNRLTTLSGLEHLPNLASLVAAENRLEVLLDFSAPSPNGSRLRLADLSRNRIATLAPHLDAAGRACGIEAHTHLEVLQLNENAIQSLGRFAALHSLHTLSLSRNEVQNQEGATIGGMFPAGLTCLDLSHNRHLSAVPPSLEVLGSLRSLSLEGCPIDGVELGHGLRATSGIVVWGNDEVEERVHRAYRWHVLQCVPHIHTLDGLAVTSDERAHAAALTSGAGGDASIDDVAAEVLRRRRKMRADMTTVDMYYRP